MTKPERDAIFDKLAAILNDNLGNRMTQAVGLGILNALNLAVPQPADDSDGERVTPIRPVGPA